MGIIYNKDKFAYSNPLMRDMNALSAYQINIFQVLKFMYKAKHILNPRLFDNTFRYRNSSQMPNKVF